ncbi:hypothetical protein U1Q18_006056 [Sarracenia purpurea var. burkii]
MWVVGEDEGTHVDGWVCWEVYSRVFAAVYSDPTKLGFSDLSVAVVDAAVPCSGATGAGIVLYALRGCFEVVSKEEEQQLVSWIVVIDGNNPNRSGPRSSCGPKFWVWANISNGQYDKYVGKAGKDLKMFSWQPRLSTSS